MKTFSFDKFQDFDFSKYSAVIFDFDGTLYDSSHFPIRLIRQIPFDIFKIRSERKVRHSLKGQFFGDKFSYSEEQKSRLCKIAKFKTKESARIWYDEIYMKAMLSVLEKYYDFRPNTKEIFQKLKNMNIKTAIFSDYGIVFQRIQAIGLEKSISDYVFSAEELGGLKPSAEPFIKIAEIMGFCDSSSRKKILVIGDREDTDGQGAKNSGMDFALVE